MVSQALLPVLKSPVAQQLLISLAGGVYNSVNPSRVQEIQQEVLEDMQANRKKLSRQSEGRFTGAEREQIRAGAEPGLNRLAGNIAQRGLGTSGAGAQVMSQASVLPYTQAQQGAQQALVSADAAIVEAVSGFPADTSFFDDIGATVRAYYEYRGLRGLAEADIDDKEDPLFSDLFNGLLKLGKQFISYMQSQSQPSGGDPFIRDMQGNVVDHGF